MSSPLTTGQRAVEWLARNGGASAGDLADHVFRAEVYEPNRTFARNYVHSMRQRVSGVVIDPTAVGDIGGWSQGDYRFAWGEVITRFCRKAIFLDDWQYSNGCAYEYTVAYSTGVEVLKADLSPLTLEAARSLLREAISDSEQSGANVAFLRSALEILDRPSAAART